MSAKNPREKDSNERIVALEYSVKNIEERVRNVEKAISNIYDIIDEIKKEIFNKIDDGMKDMEDRVNAAFNQIEEIKKEILSMQIRTIQDISSINSKIDGLKKDINFNKKVPLLIIQFIHLLLTLILLLKNIGLLK